jgi:YbbR domain-containing protein
VQDVELTPDEVEVQVRVRRLVDSKPDVEVVPDLRGDPAPGYRLGSVKVEPQQVTLFGVPAVLEQVPGFVETLPISVTGATQDVLERTTLSVPNGIVVYGGNYVTVKVEVLPIESSRAMTATVEIQGVRPTWIATPSPDVVNVILEGPDAILSALEPAEVQVTLDLFGYDLGVYRVEIMEGDVLVPVGVTVVSVIPETIEVVIIPLPTPTPTITPTATAEP